MPNWTWNRIRCKKEMAERILTKNDLGEYDFDFNKLIPMPKDLSLPAGSMEDLAVASYYISLNDNERAKAKKILETKSVGYYGNYYEKYKRNINSYLEKPDLLKKERLNFNETKYNSEYNVESLNEFGKKYFDNIDKYGYSQWYEWCCDNWGTKWNVEEDVSVSIDDNNENYEIEFNTAWNCPYGIINEYARLCEDGDLDWCYQDEDEEELHQLTKVNGVVECNIVNSQDMEDDVEI